MEDNNTAPKVFISYSWVVSDRVEELAKRLVANGVNVVIDIWDLKVGQDKYAFMEQCVNDASIFRVLIICDESYMIKANNRKGGVGDEAVIITPEIYGHAEQEKFIPILFEKDGEGKGLIPHFIKPRIYIDLSGNDDNYEREFEALIRNIHRKPLHTKPALGRCPDWLNIETVDFSAIRDITKQIYSATEGSSKASFLVRKAKDEIIEAARLFSLSEVKAYDDALLDVIDQLKLLRDITLDYIDALICSGFNLSIIIVQLMEDLYNLLNDTSTRQGNQTYICEGYVFFVWELFICITATLLYYEKYAELHLVLMSTYFLKKDQNDSLTACYYSRFRRTCNTIERICKPKCTNPALFTLQADILVHRERKPILTVDSITNADLLLYQLYSIIIKDGENYHPWFPLTYVYREDKQDMWVRLRSQEYCKKLFPLFGVNTIEELKSQVAESNKLSDKLRFHNCFETPMRIESSISIDNIGIMN